MPRRKTQEETIAQFKAVHGDKYDYSKVEYKRCDSKIRIICPKHGEFYKIRLIEIPYTKIDDIEKILTNKILNQEKN